MYINSPSICTFLLNWKKEKCFLFSFHFVSLFYKGTKNGVQKPLHESSLKPVPICKPSSTVSLPVASLEPSVPSPRRSLASMGAA